MKTPVIRSQDIHRRWHLLDADGQILGRLSTRIASYLIGKHKPDLSPNLDTGDYVVVVNAAKIQVTGNKLNQKIYYRHSNFPGGLKQEPLKDLLRRNPIAVIEKAVKGMLPKNKLQSRRLKRLKVFVEAHHPYQDQIERS